MFTFHVTLYAQYTNNPLSFYTCYKYHFTTKVSYILFSQIQLNLFSRTWRGLFFLVCSQNFFINLL